MSSSKWGTLSPCLQSWRGLVLQNAAFEPRKGKWLTVVAQRLRHRLRLVLPVLTSQASLWTGKGVRSYLPKGLFLG